MRSSTTARFAGVGGRPRAQSAGLVPALRRRQRDTPVRSADRRGALLSDECVPPVMLFRIRQRLSGR